jgi:pimeloyl-ACP methyl ester carboxylesterase
MAVQIVLIHGAFSRPLHFAAWIAFFSAAGFECHAPALPGHASEDAELLRSVSLPDYLLALTTELRRLPSPPVLIGHSMGGLLAQQLAATEPCRGLVCLASAPPWSLSAQPGALRYLLPMMPAILTGRPIRPTTEALCYLALNGLPSREQSELLPTFGAESGRAYRAMITGRVRVKAKPYAGPVLCLAGRADRIISSRTSEAIARHCQATYETFEHGHWLIAPSARDQVAGRVLRWIEERVQVA